MYAIKHIKSGKYVSGTDYTKTPPSQILNTGDFGTLVFGDVNIDAEVRRMQIDFTKYKIVKVRVTEVKDQEDVLASLRAKGYNM